MTATRGLSCTLLVLFAILAPISTDAQQSRAASFPVITSANVDELAELAAFTPATGALPDSLRFLDDETIAFVTWRGRVHTWNVTGFPTAQDTSIDSASSALVDSTGRMILCQCSDASSNQDIKQVNLDTGEVSMLIPEFPVSDWMLDANEQLLAVAGGWTRNDVRFEIWDLQQRAKLFSIGYEQWPSAVKFHPLDSYILAAAYLNTIEIWNIETNTKLFTFKHWYPISALGSIGLKVGNVAFNSDGTVLASMSPEGFVWLWDVQTGENIEMLRDESMHVDMCDCYFPDKSKLAFSPDDALLIAANGVELRLWDLSTNQLARTINQPIVDVVFNDAGTLMATVDGRGAVKFWGIAGS